MTDVERYEISYEERYELAVERQTCDSCGAKQGEPCRTAGGAERAIPHQPRLDVFAIRRDVRSMICPTCKALPGESCRPGAHHKSRIGLARRAPAPQP